MDVPGGLIFGSRTQCLLHLRASHVAPEPKVVFKPPPADDPETPKPAPAAAATGWRLRNPNQQRMLVKIKHLDLSSVPYLTEGSRVLLLTELETEPVAEAAGSSSVAYPAKASTVTAKPPFPVSSAVQAKASVAKPPKKAKGSVGAALSRATPAGTAAPVAASSAGPPVPTPKAAGTGGVALAGRLGLKAGRRTARTPPLFQLLLLPGR